MCDYSLHNVRTRLAVEGEPLEVHRFTTGSLGLASPAELRPALSSPIAGQRQNWWQTIKNWFGAEPPVAAVCIPPGAQLVARDIPETLQQKLGVGPDEEVTFVQLSPETLGYRDAIRFDNGQEILIQRLPVGLRMDVLSLSASDERQIRTEAVWSDAASRSPV